MVEKAKGGAADDYDDDGDAGCAKAGTASTEDGGGDVWSEACQSEDPTRVSQKDLQGFAAEAVKKFRDMQ